MIAPKQVRPAYEYWKDFLKYQVDFWLKTSDKHTKEHCKRVLLYCLLIANQKHLPVEEQDILCTVAVFHDSRRQDDWLDVGHGQRAANYYREFCTVNALLFQQRCYDVIAYHDRDDQIGIDAIRGRALQEPDAVLLYQVFKDADALDRFRLGPGGFDPKYLRTDEAKALVEYAEKVWKICCGENAEEVICSNRKLFSSKW